MINFEILPYFITSASILILSAIFFLIYPLIYRHNQKKNYISVYGKSIYKFVYKEDYYLINRLILSHADGTSIHIDHFLAGNKFIYIIKDKYFDGAILGNYHDSTWIYGTKKHGKVRKQKIDNPLLLNQGRIRLLKQITNIDDSMLISVVLVNNDAIIDDSLKKEGYEGNEFIIKRRELPKLVKAIENRKVADLNSFELKNIVLDIANLNENKERRK